MSDAGVNGCVRRRTRDQRSRATSPWGTETQIRMGPVASEVTPVRASTTVPLSFGVVQVPLPAGEFIVGMEDPAGVRRFGVVRFEGIPDDEGWHVD